MNDFDTQGSILTDILKDLNSKDDVNPADISEEKQETVNPPEDTFEPTQPQLDASGLTSEDYEELEQFSYNGFQVVRREFFSHILDPSIIFCDYKVQVNKACLNKLPDVEYVQMLVNRDTKILALRPCNEYDRDSFPWATAKRNPKSTTCRILFALLMNLMGWNPDHRYKMLGKLVHANGEWLFVFDLTSAEIYQRTIKEDGKIKTSRTAVLPGSWEGQFGMPFEEHQKSLKINTFEGYAVLTVRDTRKKPDSDDQREQEEVSKVNSDSDDSFDIPIYINEGGKHNE